jgi:hypothetical protein
LSFVVIHGHLKSFNCCVKYVVSLSLSKTEGVKGIDVMLRQAQHDTMCCQYELVED